MSSLQLYPNYFTSQNVSHTGTENGKKVKYNYLNTHILQVFLGLRDF